MSNLQLYLAIGIPVVTNAIFIGLFWVHMNTRFEAINQRFDDMMNLWRAELRRVEEVIDARLKHLEDKP